MALNRERVMLGVAALRSGEYRKGRGYLHRVDTDGTEFWCCLGVFTDVARKNGLMLDSEMIVIRSGGLMECFNDKGEYLCPAARDWFGFAHVNPLLETPQGRKESASNWNDWGLDNQHSEEDFTAMADAFERLADAS